MDWSAVLLPLSSLSHYVKSEDDVATYQRKSSLDSQLAIKHIIAGPVAFLHVRAIVAHLIHLPETVVKRVDQIPYRHIMRAYSKRFMLTAAGDRRLLHRPTHLCTCTSYIQHRYSHPQIRCHNRSSPVYPHTRRNPQQALRSSASWSACGSPASTQLV